MLMNLHEHAIDVRVYYEDTDAGGVVYYANYLRFFERARTELLRACGISQDELLARLGIAFMVRSVEVDYLASAKLDDCLVVTATIEKSGRASAQFAQKVLRGSDLIATASVRVVCVNLSTNRPVGIPSDVLEVLARYIAPTS